MDTTIQNFKNEETVLFYRTYKDRVFRMLFRSKKRLLELYNALNGTEYTNEDFIATIRKNMETMPMEEAVRNAVEKCISENILRDFLIEQKAEVIAMSIYEYNEEYVKKVLYEDGYDSGYKKGASAGEKKGKIDGLTIITASIRKMHSRNFPPEEIADLLNQKKSVVIHILKLLNQHPMADNEEIAKIIASEKL